MLKYGIQSYRKINVTTSDPVKLIIMCYEGAINNIMIAKEKFYKNDYEGKGKAIQKAVDIIAELQNSIDFKKGGEIAKNLDAIYSLVTGKIIQADLDKDPEALGSAVEILSDLLNAWEILHTGQNPILPNHKTAPEMRPDQIAT